MSVTALPRGRETNGIALTSTWVDLGGHRFHYVTTGPESAPALLFLHGYTDSWHSGELLIPHLRDQFRIFALDQRGHGETGAGFSGYALNDFAADALAFIRKVIAQPVTLVGHSLGSLVAQRIAAQEPDLVTRLVLIGSTDKAGGNPALDDLRSALDDLGETIPYEFARAFQESTVIKPIDPAQLETFIQESLRLTPEVWRKVAETLSLDDEVVADRISTPTLILWGDRDGIFDLKAQGLLESLLKRGELTVYNEIGHAPNWEIPETVARDILAFHGL
jgi:non-heme chloroperoxidase